MKALLVRVRIDACPEPSSAEAYRLLESITPNSKLDHPEEEHGLLTCLASLELGMEHWLTLGPSKATFLLVNWLNGVTPPPRSVAVQCSGMTKKKKKCKTVGHSLDSSIFYCAAHLDQKPESISASSEPFQATLASHSRGPSEVGRECEPNNSDAHHGAAGVPCTRIFLYSGGWDIDAVLTEPGVIGDGEIDGAIHDPETGEKEDVDRAMREMQVCIVGHDPGEFTEDDVVGPITFGVCPDACYVASDDYDSTLDELPARKQHLRDTIEGESTLSSESDDDERVGLNDNEYADGLNVDPGNWSWDQSLSERWKLVSELLRQVCTSVARLAVLAEEHVELARRKQLEASARALKRARLIGATVVDATRRLHAIRATEPFAMVVEEACEVLEPTLVSVLAVRSLHKLELIGDHRQLPAFLQACWFGVETTHPSVKVSLLERLFENCTSADEDRGVSPCIILKEPRRMRPEICELTRCEYEDVVQIIDHALTVKQRIADNQLLGNLPAERKLWRCEGVPGIKPEIFFWDLESKEGRAAVGLSRCNNTEVEACAALVKWLLCCNVPPATITVITSCKSQRLAILKKLRKVPGALSNRFTNHSNAKKKDGFVSTVDRYEGDKNDIVILSLVSMRPGNRFVALPNRFIVATLPARVGFYILSASGAIAKNIHGGPGPSHLFGILRDLERSASVKGNIQDGLLLPNRIGRKLVICCLRHNRPLREISEASDFPSTSEERAAFCSELCLFHLPWYKHRCQFLCHSPKQKQHTSKCEISATRPRETHAHLPLRCCDVPGERSGNGKSLIEALSNFKCDVIVDYHRPECSHIVSLPCHRHVEVLESSFELEPCEEVVGDYLHPACGHRITKPSCHNRRRWENTPPPCLEMVLHVRGCGCKTRMTCHNSFREGSLNTLPPCLEAVSKPRPRCSHLLVSSCFAASALRELWSKQNGEAVFSSPPVVVHGTKYGPSESVLIKQHPSPLNKGFPQCRVKTSYRASCGHSLNTMCSKAFELAAGTLDEDPCPERTTFQSPICGHQISASCFLKSACAVLVPSLWVERLHPQTAEVERVADEHALEVAPPMNQSLKELSYACNRTITILRKCGHTTDEVPCSHLLSNSDTKRLPPCNTLVALEHSCGHVYEIPCNRQDDPPPVCNEPVDDVFMYPCGKNTHNVRPGTCNRLTQLRAIVELKCPIKVQCRRVRCTHIVDVPCYLSKNVTVPLPGCRLDANATPLVVEEGVDYSETAVGVADCLECVVYRRSCGHDDVDVPCSRAFAWAASPDDAPPCQQEIEIYSHLCDHPLRIPCNRKPAILALDPWVGLPPPRITQVFDFHGDVLTCPVVIQGERYPVRPIPDIAAILQCGLTTRLQRSCGHEEDIACHAIYAALDTNCEHFDYVQCETCGHKAPVRCHEVRENAIPRQCTIMVEKTCAICDVNLAEVECFREMARCDRKVSADLPCGHPVTWTCGKDDDPRARLDKEPCLSCAHRAWSNALAVARDLFHGMAGAANPNKKSELLAAAAEARRDHKNIDGVMPYFDPLVLVNELRVLSLKAFPTSWVKATVDLETFVITQLVDVYIKILRYRTDLLAQAIANNERGDLIVRPPLKITDAKGAYDIVYCVLPAARDPSECFRPTDTHYGFGIIASILSEDALVFDSQKRSKDGSLSLCVAAALRHQMLEDTPPFRAKISTNGRNKKQRERNDQASEKARKLVQTALAKGYDHVSLELLQQPFARVYWYTGALIPLYQLEVQFHRQCNICLDDALPKQGWHCSQDHFLCRGCFSTYVKQAQGAGATKRTVDDDGHLLCPHDGCNTKYEIPHLLGQKQDASEEEIKVLHAELEQLKIATLATREVRAALDKQRRALEAEFQKIQQIQDLDERRAELLRLEIIDRILTLRCPKEECRMAFVDFDGCFVLRCSACHVQFCAWCLKLSSGDMHAHAANCPEASQAGYYHSLEVFNRHHCIRRKRFILDKLQGERPDVRNLALARLQKELKNLNITI